MCRNSSTKQKHMQNSCEPEFQILQEDAKNKFILTFFLLSVDGVEIFLEPMAFPEGETEAEEERRVSDDFFCEYSRKLSVFHGTYTWAKSEEIIYTQFQKKWMKQNSALTGFSFLSGRAFPEVDGWEALAADEEEGPEAPLSFWNEKREKLCQL